MDIDNDAGMPEELKKVLEGLEMAGAVSEAVDPILEAVKELGLGKKAGEVLEALWDELYATVGPLVERYNEWNKQRLNDRLEFIKKAANTSQISEQTALAIVKMGHEEHAALMYKIKTGIHEWQAKQAERKVDAKNVTQNILSSLGMNRARCA